MASQVRAWAPQLMQLQQANELDGDLSCATGNLQLELAEMLRFFEKLEIAVDASMRCPPQVQEYRSPVLLSAVLLLSSLKSERRLAEVVELVSSAAFPAPLVDESVFAQLMRGSFPAGATVLRAGMVVTFAFILYIRSLAAEKRWYRYITADSSPQCGRNWLLSLQTWLEQGNAVRAWEAVQRLVLGHPEKADMLEAQPQSLDLQDRRELELFLQSALIRHVGVPVALGGGRASVQDKVAAFLHSEAMESHSRDALLERMNEVVSWTGLG